MAASLGAARLSWPEGKIVHYSSAAVSSAPRSTSSSSASSDGDLSLTDSCSISVALLGHCETVVEQHGVASRRELVPGAVTVCGPDPIRWLGGGSGSGASEFIEITAGASFRGDLAEELGVPDHADLDDSHGWSDPMISAITTRFRSAARHMIVLDDLERDLLLRQLYARVLQTRFGACEPARGSGRLDGIRLNRVVEFIEAHLGERLTIADLAEVAALSPFHFVRAFQRSSGLTPHAYVRARRLERARTLLAGEEPIGEIAVKVGFYDQSHLTRHFKRSLGHTPQAFRRNLPPVEQERPRRAQ